MVMNPSSNVCKIDTYPVMRNIQILPVPRVGLDLSSFLQIVLSFGNPSYRQINKLLNKLLQILLCTIWIDKGLFDCRVWAQQGRGGATGKIMKWSFPLVTVQGDSGFDWKASNRLTALSTMEAKITALSACCRELFPIMDMVSSVTKSVQLPIGKIPWMSPYMNTIWEHLCWRKLCLHSLHPRANTTQSRLFGLVKKSPREMFNYTRSTLSNNWVTSLKGLTRFVFEYLRKKIMGW